MNYTNSYLQRYYRIHHENYWLSAERKACQTDNGEDIYNSIRKQLNDEYDIVKCKTNIDYLINKGIVEVMREDEEWLVFITERTEESSEESGEQTIPETNIQTEYR